MEAFRVSEIQEEIKRGNPWPRAYDVIMDKYSWYMEKKHHGVEPARGECSTCDLMSDILVQGEKNRWIA